MTARKLRAFRIDLRLKGVGRLRITSGTTQRREYLRRLQLVRDLHADGRLDVLCALRDGAISLVEVLAGSRETGVRSLAALLLHRPLWPAVDAALAEASAGAETVGRYRLSLTTLRTCGVLGAKAKVRDLATVDWAKVRPHFGGASDWNHLRRALSRVLTLILGDMTHPFRREVVTRLEWEAEEERTPDVTVEQFWTWYEALPDWARDPVRTVAFTGMRIGLYLRADASHLHEATHEIRHVSKGRKVAVQVPAILWPVVAAAIPARYARAPREGERNSATPRYQRLAKACQQASAATGIRLTLHALRHLHGQLASDLGASDGAVADVLGHESATTTRRYTRRTGRRGVTEAVAAELLRRRA